MSFSKQEMVYMFASTNHKGIKIMKKSFLKLKIVSLIFFSFIGIETYAQKQFNFSNHTITIGGTSNIHDWEMDVEKINGFIKMEVNANNLNIYDVQLSIPVKSMKSGKSKMDKNTYEALKEERNPTITFTYVETLGVEKIRNDSFKANIKGKLSIAGKTQMITIPLSIDTNDLKVTSTYRIIMTDYGVEPPTAVFGTIKTGDTIDINFNLNYIK